MAYNLECVDGLVSAMNGLRNRPETLAAFNEGFALSPIFEIISTTNITQVGVNTYNIQPMAESINTQLPVITACDANVPLVGESMGGKTGTFLTQNYSLAAELCRTDCTAQTLRDKYLGKVRAAGAGFGALAQNLFFFGDSHNTGFNNVIGRDVIDASATPWADLPSAEDPQVVANFFFRMIAGKGRNSVIGIGPLLKELLVNKSYGTGNCAGFWDCVLVRLSTSLGLTVEQTGALFETMPILDYVTGANANAKEDVHSIVLCVDRDHVSVGSGFTKTECAFARNSTIAYTPISMELGGLRMTRMNAITLAFGVVPHEKIIEAEAGRYKTQIPAINIAG